MSQNKIAQQLNSRQSTLNREFSRITSKRDNLVNQAKKATLKRRIEARNTIKIAPYLVALINL